ncbi:MAG: stage IV sporulation protein A [Clostridia bacterium]|nr:stage IV sporulation protein A [Clostridia bacterium]
MEKFDIYDDIARLSGGDIHIGIVGPVRTGKSTFLSRFMQTMVIPYMADDSKIKEALDEMPQAGSGKTVMTTEPKFVPAEGAPIRFSGKEEGKAEVSVRLIDCVGYLVQGALGTEEEGAPRLVKTVWSADPMPFEKAAELGTKKVICDHSTVAVLVTADGTFADLAREAYISAEERVCTELKNAKKPFVIVLNSAHPEEDSAKKLRASIEEKYQVPCILLSAEQAGESEFSAVLERLLFEFPLKEISFRLPDWMQALPQDSPLLSSVLEKLKCAAKKATKLRDYTSFESVFGEEDKVENPIALAVLPAEGKVEYEIAAKDGVFYEVLSKECGEEITGEYALMSYCKSLSRAKAEYRKLKDALLEVQEKGYGVVIPKMEDMTLEEPQLVKKGGACALKIRANAPSLHIMRVDVSTDITPVVGNEEQSKEMAQYLKTAYEEDPSRVWETNVFGKTLHSLIAEELGDKITAMPEDTRKKMRKTVTRIVNEGKGGVLCILL